MMTDFAQVFAKHMAMAGMSPSELAHKMWLDVLKDRNMTITDKQVEAALAAFGVGPLDQDRLHDLMRGALEAAALAAPAPAAAPGEANLVQGLNDSNYDDLCERLMDPKYDCSEEAAAAIRKLVTARDLVLSALARVTSHTPDADAELRLARRTVREQMDRAEPDGDKEVR
jgi:hypothetical protein